MEQAPRNEPEQSEEEKASIWAQEMAEEENPFRKQVEKSRELGLSLSGPQEQSDRFTKERKKIYEEAYRQAGYCISNALAENPEYGRGALVHAKTDKEAQDIVKALRYRLSVKDPETGELKLRPEFFISERHFSQRHKIDGNYREYEYELYYKPQK